MKAILKNNADWNFNFVPGIGWSVSVCAGGIQFDILIYIQQDATLHNFFYLETALHVLGGTPTHHQESIQLYLQHLVFATPLLLPAAIVEELEPV
jgi:hypothetical protein